MTAIESSEPSVAGRKLLVAGHQLRFFEGISEELVEGGFEVRSDEWTGQDGHDPAKSEGLLEWADCVLCEWCLGNAAWYLRAAPPKPVFIRFHRAELETFHPYAIDPAGARAIVFVAEHVRAAARTRLDWREENLSVIPNAVRRGLKPLPKLPGARFTIAMVGWVPRLKRLDRALDLIEALREEDSRYRLIVKGPRPQDLAWMRSREEERAYFSGLLGRIESSPSLRSSVTLEPGGDDVPELLHRASYLVSCSDMEGDSVALAEGMATGTVPVVIDRPGARDQYGERWVHGDVASAARWIVGERGSLEDDREIAISIGEDRSAASIARRWRILLSR